MAQEPEPCSAVTLSQAPSCLAGFIKIIRFFEKRTALQFFFWVSEIWIRWANSSLSGCRHPVPSPSEACYPYHCTRSHLWRQRETTKQEAVDFRSVAKSHLPYIPEKGCEFGHTLLCQCGFFGRPAGTCLVDEVTHPASSHEVTHARYCGKVCHQITSGPKN